MNWFVPWDFGGSASRSFSNLLIYLSVYLFGGTNVNISIKILIVIIPTPNGNDYVSNKQILQQNKHPELILYLHLTLI